MLCDISLNKKNKTETSCVQYRIYNNRTFCGIYVVVNFLFQVIFISFGLHVFGIHTQKQKENKIT